VKILFVHLVAEMPGAATLGRAMDIPMLIVLFRIVAARFHDLGQSAWSAALWCGLAFAVQVVAMFVGLAEIQGSGPSISMQELMTRSSPMLVLVMTTPAYLLLIIVGLLPGQDTENQYGPTGQGTGGFLGVPVAAATESGLPARIDRIARATRTEAREDRVRTADPYGARSALDTVAPHGARSFGRRR
jgi:uncharacterized membrane protein YhaH (DUF805 family)